ncbi:MAG: zinc-binding dehydrogenase, partial [Stackebrandtia sp.]
TVVGLAGGPAKTARVAALSAGVSALDYRDPDWPAAVKEVLGGRQPTVVFDGVGGEVGRSALELLGVDGRFFIFGWSAGEITRLTAEDLVERGLTAGSALGPRMLKRPGGLRGLETEALAAAASGTMVPPIHAFPLKEAGLAHEALTSRDTIGKVVLRP